MSHRDRDGGGGRGGGGKGNNKSRGPPPQFIRPVPKFLAQFQHLLAPDKNKFSSQEGLEYEDSHFSNLEEILKDGATVVSFSSSSSSSSSSSKTNAAVAAAQEKDLTAEDVDDDDNHEGVENEGNGAPEAEGARPFSWGGGDKPSGALEDEEEEVEEKKPLNMNELKNEFKYVPPSPSKVKRPLSISALTSTAAGDSKRQKSKVKLLSFGDEEDS